MFVSRKQRTPRKTSNPILKDKVSKKQERLTKQYKALEDYAKELHCAAYGRSDRMLGGIRRDRSNSKLNKEKKILQSRHIEGVTL
ncbi:hypothetical protein [Bacillus albus]|uniref:hypothetical protein n=1 Tax=Bacillus albus TaxID=2026189 RepID=UPI00101ED70A|nr:hypothetical protein [Bacillus albus]